MWLTSHERKEAASRAPEYARYYVEQYGSEAGVKLRAKLKKEGTSRYYRALYRLALRHLKYLD